jgi:hypothetical protein
LAHLVMTVTVPEVGYSSVRVHRITCDGQSFDPPLN